MIDLLRESGDKFVLEGAIWCLQNFALESTETRDRLISADYVPAIVGVYQRAKDSSVGEEFLIDLVESSKQLWSSEPVAELERVIPIFKMLAEEFH